MEKPQRVSPLQGYKPKSFDEESFNLYKQEHGFTTTSDSVYLDNSNATYTSAGTITISEDEQ